MLVKTYLWSHKQSKLAIKVRERERENPLPHLVSSNYIVTQIITFNNKFSNQSIFSKNRRSKNYLDYYSLVHYSNYPAQRKNFYCTRIFIF